MDEVTFTNPDGSASFGEEAAMPMAHEAAAQQPWEELLRIPGVEGAGLSRDAEGNDVIVAYLRDEGVRKSLPASLHGMAVKAEVTGVITASAR